MSNVNGKTFLITGGASGIGAGYAEAFINHGAKSVAILDIAEEAGRATEARLNSLGRGSVIFIKCDVAKQESIDQAFKEVVENFERIDVIVNNAGIMNDSPNTWRTSCEVNVQGLISFTMKGLKHMGKDEGGIGGTIVNIASTASVTPSFYLPIYSGTKSAVLHFSRSLATDPFYKYTGIRLLTICLGPTDSPLLKQFEKQSFDSKYTREFYDFVKKDNDFPFQKISSATACMVHIVENGSPGTVWFSFNDQPARDITAILDKASNIILQELFA